MKLSMLPIVERTVAARNKVLAELEAVKVNAFTVSINGDRQDMAMMAIAKPSIELELNSRLLSLNSDLESYGVAVS